MVIGKTQPVQIHVYTYRIAVQSGQPCNILPVARQCPWLLSLLEATLLMVIARGGSLVFFKKYNLSLCQEP